MVEIWKDVPNYKNLYKVSNLGRVKSIDRIDTIGRKIRGVILKQSSVRLQLRVVLCNEIGIKKMYSVSQLVAMAFLGHKPNGHKIVVDHINNDPFDNRVENLQLISNRENLSKDKKGTSKYTGVSWNKNSKKWVSQIHINGKKIHLGYFENEIDAANAYKNKLHENNK